MTGTELTRKAQTVLGLVSGDELGITLTHEHFFEDDSSFYVEPSDIGKRLFAHQPVTLENVGRVRFAPMSNLDNLVTFDEDNMIIEALSYRLAGGNTIVDCTPVNLGRDPDGLVRISKATGLNIIMGSGYYREATLGHEMGKRSEEDIRDEIVREIKEGVGANKIRAGLIGEIGCSYPMTNNERKILLAAAQAQCLTGAPLSIHPGYGEPSALEIISMLSDAGVDISRTIMCHVDISVRQESTRRELARTGCYLEYDHLGREEYYYPNVWTIDLPDDLRRLDEIMQLISWGYLNQVLVSTDASAKCWRPSYGGWGYEHILRNFVPLMRKRGVSEDEIHTILIDNPKRAIPFI